MENYYLIFKSLHVIGVISWMAGLLYLPRLFVYHCTADAGSDKSETFKIMERRLMRVIMNPAMLISYLFGIAMLVQAGPSIWSHGWLVVKLTGVAGLTVFHMKLAAWRRLFEQDQNVRSEKFFRLMNEIPTMLMVLIVFMVILQPF